MWQPARRGGVTPFCISGVGRRRHLGAERDGLSHGSGRTGAHVPLGTFTKAQVPFGLGTEPAGRPASGFQGRSTQTMDEPALQLVTHFGNAFLPGAPAVAPAECSKRFPTRDDSGTDFSGSLALVCKGALVVCVTDTPWLALCPKIRL